MATGNWQLVWVVCSVVVSGAHEGRGGGCCRVVEVLVKAEAEVISLRKEARKRLWPPLQVVVEAAVLCEAALV